jgi:hypothetical protein
MRRFPLGAYPEMGISDARKAAQSLRVDVRRGVDPVADAKRQRSIGKEAHDGTGTFAATLDLYAKQQGHRIKSWRECRRRIDSVFAPFLAKPLVSLKLSDLQMQAHGWAAPQSAAAAVRYLRPIMKWDSRR